MRNENSDILEVCVGVNEEGGKVLIGERFRKKDGRIPVRWHVDPKTSETSEARYQHSESVRLFDSDF